MPIQTVSLLMRLAATVTMLLIGPWSSVLAQDSDDPWDVTKPRGQTREIDVTTSEGTWMSVDISPDGRWIVFDLLAHIYRMPAHGGQAECLTQDSGVALNFHPRFSPDGKHIVFVSDRLGQTNPWIMEADGSNPRPIFVDNDLRIVEPTWTPDGEYIIVRRQDTREADTWSSRIWMYHRGGGQGVELLGRNIAWPSVSPEGAYVYFHVLTCPPVPYNRIDVVQGCYQIRRLELRTGMIEEVTSGSSINEYQSSSGSSSGGAVAPEVSPDGRWLAFARRIPDGTISYKGHKYGPRTALWLRDLRTGSERVLMDPIEPDLAEETMKTMRILPGYSWARDGKSIVISQGGKIRRVSVESGKVDTINFTARIRRTISEMAWGPFEISDGPFDAKAMRWQTASPDGRRLVFQAVGKIWMMDLPEGTPRRLTSTVFEPFEFAPAWSPDGQWIAFTSWDEKERGFVWKVPADGGTPTRITEEPGEYLNPAWDSDGNQIVVARGSGATARGRPWSKNPWYDLVLAPADAGPPESIAKVVSSGSRSEIVQPSFALQDRVFYTERASRRGNTCRDGSAIDAGGREVPATELLSVKKDGSDKRSHLLFPYAVSVVPSPDGKWVSFQEGDNVYVMPFPSKGTGGTAPCIDKKKGQFPVKQLSFEGGLSPRWRGNRALEFGFAATYFAYHLDSERTDAVRIQLRVPRDLPSGTVALTGGRIITLDGRKVIEKGTILVKGSRIACVGKCDIRGVDKAIDVTGKTIIPGFIDMHAHHHSENAGVTPPHNFETAIYLAYGVTTTLDPSARAPVVFSTAELVEAGAVIGPRVFSTGDTIYWVDRAHSNEITDYAAAEQNIQRVTSWGATVIKQYWQPRREQRQWLVDVARKRELMVTSEGSTDLEYKLTMLMDGHTGFEHATPNVPLYGDVAKFFGRAKVFSSGTFIVAGPGPFNQGFFYQSSDVWKDEKQRRFLPWRHLISHTRRRMLRPVTDYSYPLLAQGLADIVAEGGYGAIGGHGQHDGLASHWETWILASAMGPMGALEVASLHGARFIGVEKDLGSITPGKLADLMVLNANPLDDIQNTVNIQYVMKGGRLYNADTLDEVWPKQKAFGEYYWVDPDALRSDDRPVDYWDRPQNGAKSPQTRPNVRRPQ